MKQRPGTYEKDINGYSYAENLAEITICPDKQKKDLLSEAYVSIFGCRENIRHGVAKCLECPAGAEASKRAMDLGINEYEQKWLDNFEPHEEKVKRYLIKKGILTGIGSGKYKRNKKNVKRGKDIKWGKGR